MKKINLKCLLSISFLAIAGLFGVSSLVVNKQANESPIVEKAEADSVARTVYLQNNYALSNFTVHYWNDSSSGDYTPVEDFTDGSSKKIYKAVIPAGMTGWAFHGYYNSWSRDTWCQDLAVPNNNTTAYYISGTPSGWDKFQVGSYTLSFFTVVFNSNGGSGTMANQTCHCDCSVGNNLNANAFTKTGYSFSSWNTSSDGKGTSYAGGSQITNNTSGATVTLYAQWNHAAGRYIVGSFCGWGIDGAFFLEPKNSQYEGGATLSYGDTFKIGYYNGTKFVDADFYGYSWIRSGCGAFHYFSGYGDSNVTCEASGSYSFYFRDVEYESGKKISIEVSGDLNAEHLAAQLMAIGEWEGHCGDADRFPAMKTFYLGLGSSARTTFQGYVSSDTDQFRNAYNRYVAWAAALGEKPWESGKVSSAIRLGFSMLGNDEPDNVSTIVIIIASSTALLSITALSVLVIKKRKHKEQ